MKKSSLLSLFILTALLLAASSYLLGRSRGADKSFQFAADLPNTPPPQTASVSTILDPITVQLDTGHIVRYLGVRAPKVSDTVECFGKEALKANESTIGHNVRLESDPVLERSQDGAWARYVYLLPEDPVPSPENTPTTAPASEEESRDNEAEEDPPSPTPDPEEPKEIFINERILEGGFGFPVLSPEMKHGERMLSAARFASATGKGLWSRCEILEDETTKQAHTQVTEECTIKGKVTSDLTKIYRTPQCSAYAQTIVVESQGGRWFCAEDIAHDEGFEKALDCPQD